MLEVLQILEGEVNLREETRVAEQARAALASEEYGKQAGKLSKTQDGLRERVDKVIDRIKQLPDAESEFAYEIGLLGKVSGVMSEATEILATPGDRLSGDRRRDRGHRAACSSRSGSIPRAAAAAARTRAAAARARPSIRPWRSWDRGVNQKEVREDRGVSQATGESGPVLPEEFRAGPGRVFQPAGAKRRRPVNRVGGRRNEPAS